MKTGRIINPETKKNLYSLLKSMDGKTTTVYSSNRCGFTTTYTTGAKLKGSENGVFGSNNLPRLENYPAAGTSLVRLNGKEYTIDNLTGEVKQRKFSLLKISKKTIEAISNLINKVSANLENPEIVEQYSWGICGMTAVGAKKWQESLQKCYENLKAKGINTNKD